jgi:hypothetical protein
VTGPSIAQTDDRVGFHWRSSTGEPATLTEVALADSEPERLLPTHLEALDDVLIAAATQFGDVLGGGRKPDGPVERAALLELQAVLDRLCLEYHAAAEATGLAPDLRAGQIVGTAALMGTLARDTLGLAGPVPFAGQLDDPSLGVVAGYGELVTVDADAPWRGGRWVVRTEDGRRLPATLSMLLFDSSGVNKDAALDEHRSLLRSVVASASEPDAVPEITAGAVDWLLYDWLVAHRDGPDSGAIELRSGQVDDARMIVAAAGTSAAIRQRVIA